MYSAISVAQVISKYFFLKKKTALPESELQAYLYQIQKESYRQTGKPTIMEHFFAGPDGPYIPAVRNEFRGETLCRESEELDDSTMHIINTVLTSPSHPSTKDFTWQKARIPLAPDAEKANPIQDRWIAEEVESERVRDERFGLGT